MAVTTVEPDCFHGYDSVCRLIASDQEVYSGSGKSTLALSNLTKLIEQRVPFVTFDHKRSVRALKAMGLPVQVSAMGRHIDAAMHFDPLIPFPGVPADAHIGQFPALLLLRAVGCDYGGARRAVSTALQVENYRNT